MITKGKRLAALALSGVMLFTVLNLYSPDAGKIYADENKEENISYNGATVNSRGTVGGVKATVRGEAAFIEKDDATGSNVLTLSSDTFGGGYLSLPENLYEGVTDSFTIVMDLRVNEKAGNYQRIFQSSSIKLGEGSTSWWDAPDISVDLCEFNDFRTSVFVGTQVNTPDDGSHRASARWGAGAKKGQWKRLALVVTKEKLTAYYDGNAYETSIPAKVLSGLFSGDTLSAYTKNTLGHSVYSSDKDICASFDNVAVYSYALTAEQINNTPDNASFLWTFDDEDIVLNERAEGTDNTDTYTDGTKLTKVEEISSPDGKINTYILCDKAVGRYFYSCTYNNEAVIHASLLGVKTETADFSKGLSLDNDSIRKGSGKDEYALKAGKNLKVSDEYKDISFDLTNEKGKITIILRVYNDGTAYRYTVSENGAGTGKIKEETGEFVLPDNTVFWAGEPSDTYEGTYSKKTTAGITDSDMNMSTPLLASVKNNKYWVLMTEANVFNEREPFCASIFATESGKKNIKWTFGRKQTESVSVSYPFTTPWRVAVITDNINGIASTNIITDLNPEPDASIDYSFVKPGKAAWSWWSSSYDAIEPQTQKDYIDFAADNGWEYVLVDYGWELWEDYEAKIKDIVDYGKEKGVGVFLWYGVDKFDGKHIFELDDRETIDKQFAWCRETGVAGIKIDYINSDSQSAMKILYDLADSAAKNSLMIVYHGCTNPNGENRTYPNILSYEAVRGSEYYKWGTGADVSTLLTYLYTRNAIGSMDFTPTGCRLTTLDVTVGFQAAQTIVYESAVQHFAHSAYVYEGSVILSLLNDIPTVWEDSVYGGYPGEHNWAARKSGEDWYVGAMTAEAMDMEILLDFLEKGKEYTAYVYKDNDEGNDLLIEEIKVTAGDKLLLKLIKNGGAAVKITEGSMKTATPYDERYTYYEAENAKVSGKCTIDENNYASGLKSVGYIGQGAGNDILFENIHAEKAGSYELEIFFISGTERDIYVSVNDKEPVKLSKLLSYTNDWSAVGKTVINIELKEGSNTVRLLNEEAYAPSIDRIGVSKKTADSMNTEDSNKPGNDSKGENAPETTGSMLIVIIIISVVLSVCAAAAIIFICRRAK